MTPFTPWSAALGGGLIGTAAVLLWWLNGRMAGVSGVAGGVLAPGPVSAQVLGRAVSSRRSATLASGDQGAANTLKPWLPSRASCATRPNSQSR